MKLLLILLALILIAAASEAAPQYGRELVQPIIRWWIAPERTRCEVSEAELQRDIEFLNRCLQGLQAGKFTQEQTCFFILGHFRELKEFDDAIQMPFENSPFGPRFAPVDSIRFEPLPFYPR